MTHLNLSIESYSEHLSNFFGQNLTFWLQIFGPQQDRNHSQNLTSLVQIFDPSQDIQIKD